MKPSHTTTAQKLTRARVQLLLGQPFFGTLSLRLKLIPGSLPTMATDGSRIVYNPAFVDELKPVSSRSEQVEDRPLWCDNHGPRTASSAPRRRTRRCRRLGTRRSGRRPACGAWTSAPTVP